MSTARDITNEDLKSILSDAMVCRGEVTMPLEEITQPGYYQINAGTPASELSPLGTTLPRLSLMEVVIRGEADVIQRITETNNGVPNIYIRVKRLGTWKPWYKFTGTPLPS